MKTTSHTNGPWSYWPDSCGGVVTQDKTACHVCVPTDRPEKEANARLIAAAPELLESLDMIAGLLPVLCANFGVVDDFGLEVTEKATGETREILFSEVLKMAIGAIEKATNTES